MRKTKVHPIKGITYQHIHHPIVLLLGPLPIGKKDLQETMKSLQPSAVIYIDGGIKHKNKLRKLEKVKEISIGDGDSGRHVPDYLLPEKKDFSDLSFALSCLKGPMEKIILLGFSAPKDFRRDHFLINLGEIEKFVRKKKIPAFIDRHIHIYPSGKHKFEANGLFSIMTLQKNSLKITGSAEYKLRKWTNMTPLSSLGLSNSGSGQVSIESKGPVIIYFVGKNSN